MLFPIKAATEAHRAAERQRIETEGQTLSPRCYYMKQTVGNACGTVGLLHCVANAKDSLTFQPESFIDKFIRTTASMSPDERASYLEENEEIEETHEAAASEGQSTQVAVAEDVDTHFVCFTLVLVFCILF